MEEETIICTVLEDGVQCGNITYSSCVEGPLTPQDGLFWLYLGIYVFLVILAGLMSGLTMGLLSLDLLSLKVLKTSGNVKQRKFASSILPLVEKHHLLLVTLLVANAASVEAMPIFLDRISNPIVAIVVSVSAVLLFGEVIPQALCTRYGLAIGYYLSPLIKILMVLLFFIAWPISKLLDLLLGKDHSTFFRRAELKELVDMHGKTSQGNEEPLSQDEVLIIKGALEMRSKTVREAMTPLQSVFMLRIDDKLDRATMQTLIDVGHSRVPVFDGVRQNIVGIILVKKIIMLDPDDAVPVREVYMSIDNLPRFRDDMPLYDLLNKFQEGKSHMGQVWGPKDRPDNDNDKVDKKEQTDLESEVLGVITLEDVIEELIQEEIVDETDVFVDVHRRILVARAQTARRQSISLCEGASNTSKPHAAARHIIRRAKSQQSNEVTMVNINSTDMTHLGSPIIHYDAPSEDVTPLLQGSEDTT
ncbi:uncharacterized protein LOC134186870 [Corticium candelabrum]|uniref:uncharacterized protein LOC134186870 n=1 Tax=Corticium candelabrum TaxID=121492 RepID=UPI002E267417|nr:uncharacterized protein LOC134186870 [Corticium candelabrum]